MGHGASLNPNFPCGNHRRRRLGHDGAGFLSGADSEDDVLPFEPGHVGVAVLNGVVMVSFINSLRLSGKPLDDAVREGGSRGSVPY